MTGRSVTYTGEEIALLAGALARVLPDLDDQDFEVVDLMLDRAIAAFDEPLGPEAAAIIAAKRQRRVAP